MAVDADAVDFLHILTEEFGNVLISRPVDGNAKVIAIFVFELFLKFRLVEPVLAEPVEIGELLVRELIKLAVRSGREGSADKVFDIEPRIGDILAFARHPVRQIDGELQAGVCADQIAVIDIGVVQIALGLHLRLYSLNDLALAEQLVIDLDAGDFFKCFGERFRLIFMRRDGFRQHVDFHALEGFCCFDEPFHFLHLLFFRER